MHKINPSILFWPILLLLFVLTGLSTQDVSVPLLALPRTGNRAMVLGETFPKTLIDSYGHKVHLKNPHQKIVSAMLAADEILLDLISRRRIAAVTVYAAEPTLSNCHKQVQGLAQIADLNVEPVVAMEPDLVLASRLSNAKVLLQLRKCGVPVFSFGHYDSLGDIRKNVVLLGKVLGAKKRSRTITNWMDQTLQEVRTRTADVKDRPRVLYHDGGFTAGKDTVFNELVQLAGGRNVAAEAGIVGHTIMSTEMVLALNPDVILIPQPFPDDMQESVGSQPTLLKDPVFQSVRAVQKGRVYILPSQHINSISHHVVKAAVDIGHALHPDKVPTKMTLKY